MNALPQMEATKERGATAVRGPWAKPIYTEGVLRRLAFEHPALLIFLSPREQEAKKSKSHPGLSGAFEDSGMDHPAITMFLACFVELERRGYIELRSSVATWGHPNGGGVWVTKKAPCGTVSGVAIELFNCISHAHALVQEIVRKFNRNHSQEAWVLHANIGEEEAKAFGYLLRQTWPKAGPWRWLARLGVGEDTQTIWVRNGLKARAARQAISILRGHIDEFRRKAPKLYEELHHSIVAGMVSESSPSPHPTFRLPHLRRRPAN
ncbi:MAG: hypothetical protein V3U26_02350 [Dehalococcoidia bacterium]